MIEKIIKMFQEESNSTTISVGADYVTQGNAIPISRAIEIVQKVAKEYGNGWIPCEVEMPPRPKENPSIENRPLELYLVTVKGSDYPFRAIWNGVEFTDGWGTLPHVTAWQPLPPKYEPKDAPCQKGE